MQAAGKLLATSFSLQQDLTAHKFRLYWTLRAEREDNAALLKGGPFCSGPKIQVECKPSHLEMLRSERLNSTPQAKVRPRRGRRFRERDNTGEERPVALRLFPPPFCKYCLADRGAYAVGRCIQDDVGVKDSISVAAFANGDIGLN